MFNRKKKAGPLAVKEAIWNLWLTLKPVHQYSIDACPTVPLVTFSSKESVAQLTVTVTVRDLKVATIRTGMSHLTSPWRAQEHVELVAGLYDNLVSPNGQQTIGTEIIRDLVAATQVAQVAMAAASQEGSGLYDESVRKRQTAFAKQWAEATHR